MGSAKLAQAKYTHGAGRSAIGIEIADEQDALTLLQRLDQQLDRGIDALELLIRNQPRQPLVQLLCAGHATGRVEALQQRRQLAKVGQLLGQGAGFDTHGIPDSVKVVYREVAARAAWSYSPDMARSMPARRWISSGSMLRFSNEAIRHSRRMSAYS